MAEQMKVKMRKNFTVMVFMVVVILAAAVWITSIAVIGEKIAKPNSVKSTQTNSVIQASNEVSNISNDTNKPKVETVTFTIKPMLVGERK